MKHRRMTGAEFVTQLNADPAYVERARKCDAALERRAAELRVAERPLVEALNLAGLGWVRSV
jgi:hypothetical protein